MTTISELKHQIKVQKLELLSKFLKEKLTRKQELESELREINSELSEFTERYGHFYETVSPDDLDVFLNEEVKSEVKEEVKPQVKRRKPMSKETKAKISKAMKSKSKVKSKPISKAKAKEDEEYTSVEKAEVKEVEKEDLVKDLDMFRKELSKASSVKKSFYSDGESEDESRYLEKILG